MYEDDPLGGCRGVVFAMAIEAAIVLIAVVVIVAWRWWR